MAEIEPGTNHRLRHVPTAAWVMLALILVPSALLRFGGLDREGRWGDEYSQTMGYQLPPQYVALWARTEGQPPLDYLLGWALTKIEKSVWMMRAPAAFFGVLGVGACFLVAGKLASWREGLIASAMLAVSPLHWKLSQTARPYTICTAAFLLMLWTFLRALEKPDRRRLVTFGLAAYLMTLTRGLAPPVILLGTGIVSAVGCLAVWLKRSESCGDTFRRLRRVCLVTVLVGLAAVPMLVFLVQGAKAWTVFDSSKRAVQQLPVEPFLSRLSSNAMVWFQSPETMFGPGGMVVALLALAGVIICLRWWRHLRVCSRYACVIAWIVGPLYLLMFTAAVPRASITDRYGLFLVPILATFAAIAVVAWLRWCRRFVINQPVLQYVTVTTVVALVLASPAWATLQWAGRYFNTDWQGCAAYLADKVTGDDVIMVLDDRPLGKYQPPFWGKCEWPERPHRPLGESVWTLAVSESHWRRLLSKKGRCFLVVKYPARQKVGGQPPDAYLGEGLASAPVGMELVKFRGLDLLFRKEPAGDPIAGMIAACDDLLALPRRCPDSQAIPYVLRSRLQLHRGDVTGAVDSFRSACQCVPQEQKAWFAVSVAVHASAIQCKSNGWGTDSPLKAAVDGC
ncbi:MAG: glycosyltransferase family 39 protein [Phycisphaerae bacterium]|nr:glycosyltransferase family 39 protein [Phycisphaerae bacterium]